jgi:hypothetical protein
LEEKVTVNKQLRETVMLRSTVAGLAIQSSADAEWLGLAFGDPAGIRSVVPLFARDPEEDEDEDEFAYEEDEEDEFEDEEDDFEDEFEDEEEEAEDDVEEDEEDF